jgi:hypothetical protein
MNALEYAPQVTGGELLDSDRWEGAAGTYEVDFYLTGPLNVNTTSNLRYGYTLTLGGTSTARDCFGSVDQAEEHARLVMREHDTEVSHMDSPLGW